MDDMTTYAHHMGRILKAIIYIESHLDEELSLEKMAKIASISPFYFHRLFHAYIGETLAEYVKRLRLQRAAERLQNTNSPITDIALDAGYQSPAAFTKVFNQIMGESPRQYRKSMQQLMQKIIQRTVSQQKERVMLKPEYVQRKEEKVLFVRRIGDYDDTPNAAFTTLVKFLEDKKVTKEKIKTYYSMVLDDPHVVEKKKCRFDACVALKEHLAAQGEVGEKTLPGGRFAVFTHHGPYSDLEKIFDQIFQVWYPISHEQLADEMAFCEHINVSDKNVSDDERITKLYIPLKDKKR